MSDYKAILLAAGRGTRFDPLGMRDKLLEPLPDGCAVAVTAAANLLAIMPAVIAAVRPDAHQLGAELRAIGCEVICCPPDADGMGDTLAHAVGHSREAAGWLVALADMPYVKPTTIRALLGALDEGAAIVAPVHAGRRGHPVAFGRAHLAELLRLSGDVGARRLLQDYPVRLVEVDDPGIHLDVDRPQDLLLH